MSKRAGVAAILLLAQILFGQRAVQACDCASVAACSALYAADAVFTGVAQVLQDGAEQRTRFLIERSFRGPKVGRIEVVSRGIGWSCDFDFTNGTRYLVYARREPNRETWSVFLCSRTRPVSSASEDLNFLDYVVGHATGGVISGNAYVVEPIPNSELQRAVRKLTGVTVTLRTSDLLRTQETDIQGNYEFRDVPPGRYQLGLRLSPMFAPVPRISVEIKGAGGCAQHSFSVLAAQK